MVIESIRTFVCRESGNTVTVKTREGGSEEIVIEGIPDIFSSNGESALHAVIEQRPLEYEIRLRIKNLKDQIRSIEENDFADKAEMSGKRMAIIEVLEATLRLEATQSELTK